MKIVLLGDKAFERLTPIIHEYFPDTIFHTNEPIQAKLLESADLFISYGYRHIIKADQISRMKRPPVNLHISLLPWNRGADPNFWSWLDDTPKGVTIHLMDEGVDTGPIMYWKEIFKFKRDDTLRTSYEYLCEYIELMFKSVWPDIRMNDFISTPQDDIGTVHKKSDLDKYRQLLDVKGWDTLVSEVRTWKSRANFLPKRFIGPVKNDIDSHVIPEPIVVERLDSSEIVMVTREAIDNTKTEDQ